MGADKVNGSMNVIDCYKVMCKVFRHKIASDEPIVFHEYNFFKRIYFFFNRSTGLATGSKGNGIGVGVGGPDREGGGEGGGSEGL